MKKECLKWFRPAVVAGLLFFAAPGAGAETVRLENDFWELDIQARYGARATRFYSRARDYEFVVNWQPGYRDRDACQGGAFAGIMVGSFTSGRDEKGQLNQPYEVLEQSADRLRLAWRNEAPAFDGLVEERFFRLVPGRPELRLEVTVSNRSEETRVIAYRFQDWIGSGRGGYESVYICPQEKEAPHAYLFQPGVPGHNFFVNPDEPWYAMADLPNDTGMLVEVSGAPVMSFLQYLGRGDNPASRTAEIYFPMTRLAPGEQWSAAVTFTVFQPSDPGLSLPAPRAATLSADSIRGLLAAGAARRVRSGGAPLNARFAIPRPDAPLVLAPANPADADLGTALVRGFGGTMTAVHLYGTPGEAVPLVFTALARRPVDRVRLELGDLSGAGNLIGRANYESRFYSRDGFGFLVRDWALASDLPDSVAGINNDLRDAPRLTPFSLARGENAAVWNLLRIPANAVPGEYRGRAVLSGASGEELAAFGITLTVHPFTLLTPADRNYGSFFRYHLARDDDDQRPHATTRAVVRRALEQVTELGYNALFLYGEADDALWMMDQCAELGWRGSTFVSNSLGGVPPAELKARYAGLDFTVLAWTVDEPRYKHRGDIERVISRYETRLRQGYRPTYTPNSPFALIFSELLEEYVPILAMSVPSFLDVTRRYRAQGRDFYWYTAGLSTPNNNDRIEDRLRRGVYFWKEPVSGIIDWGEDTMPQRKGNSSVTGFAGTEILPRAGRENVRQALTDMRYLYTLEQRAKKTRDPRLRREAEDMLDWFRATFRDNPSYEAAMIADPHYLDELRREVGLMIARLVRGR